MFKLKSKTEPSVAKAQNYIGERRDTTQKNVEWEGGDTAHFLGGGYTLFRSESSSRTARCESESKSQTKKVEK